jgi:hypothetical protein
MNEKAGLRHRRVVANPSPSKEGKDTIRSRFEKIIESERFRYLSYTLSHQELKNLLNICEHRYVDFANHGIYNSLLESIVISVAGEIVNDRENT